MTYKRRNALRAIGDWLNSIVFGEEYQEKIEKAETEQEIAFIESEAMSEKSNLIAEYIERQSIYA